MTEVELTESTLIIHLKGPSRISAFWFRVPLKIPLTHVVGAESDPTVFAKRGLKVPEMPGFGVPGLPTPNYGEITKKFWKVEKQGGGGSYRLEGGQQGFWEGGDPQHAITIRLTDERYTELVLQVTDPASTVARIKEAAQARKSSSFYNDQGIDLADLRRYQEALASFEMALHLDPNNASAYYNKGKALIELERYEEAIAAYDHGIRLDPNNASAYYYKGFAFHNLKRYEEAIAAYDHAIRLDPNNASAYYNKGRLLERLGRNNEAQQFYEKARQLGYE